VRVPSTASHYGWRDNGDLVIILKHWDQTLEEAARDLTSFGRIVGKPQLIDRTCLRARFWGETRFPKSESKGRLLVFRPMSRDKLNDLQVQQAADGFYVVKDTLSGYLATDLSRRELGHANGDTVEGAGQPASGPVSPAKEQE
jgi:hypothetical protein